MSGRFTIARATVLLLASMLAGSFNACQAQFTEMDDLAAEQAKEKLELQDMKREMNSVKGEVNDAIRSMSELTSRQNNLQMTNMAAKEIHLFAKESDLDVGGGAIARSLTYNGAIPGPEIHVQEGEPLKVILHNELKVPTSLHFHGLDLPQSIDGLPRAGTAPDKDGVSTVKPERYLRPGESFAYQFIPQVQTTAYYHPQVMHLSQRQSGMYGALIVHTRLPGHVVSEDRVLFISKMTVSSKASATSPAKERSVYLVNGKTAPFIPALTVRAGQRVRLSVFNLTEEDVPLHLSGHRFEVVAESGSDPLEPHVVRDTVNIKAADRVDLEFNTNNPGVWSLASEKISQITGEGGKFPAGIAIVVKYKN